MYGGAARAARRRAVCPCDPACPRPDRAARVSPCPSALLSSRSRPARTTRSAATRPSRSPRRRWPAASPSRCGSPASRPGSACPAGPEDFSLPHAAPLADLLAGVLAAGSVTVCTQCAARRNIEADDLITGIRIAGAATFVAEIMTEGAQALVYCSAGLPSGLGGGALGGQAFGAQLLHQVFLPGVDRRQRAGRPSRAACRPGRGCGRGRARAGRCRPPGRRTRLPSRRRCRRR